MRKQILGAVFALALLIPVGALAQTSTTTASSTKDGHRAALQEKLAKIKDEAKRKLVEKIDGNIADLNSRMTNHFVNVLDQIQKVLDHVVQKTDKVQADGKDVTMVRVKITAAEAAIAAAKTKVTAQAAKTYAINVTTDANLRGAVKAVRKALHDDLMAAQAAVKAAREAVKEAIAVLANAAGEATSTGVTSSTHN